ncbi:MAG: glycoside hydrolase family 3 C-terminal domain-containing protein [Anaeroplasmataceae bacterium]|nr:glycoside hydrolase family 3 C-terminal domain-containing protein [Anaeroplasmataceae bacterium]
MILNDVKEIIKQLKIEDKAKLLVGADFWHTHPLLDEQGLCLTDGPHGVRMQNNGGKETGLRESIPATCFPTASALACSFDEKLLYEVGKAIARECIDQEVDMLLGPGVNIKRSPLCGRDFEYYSEDPYLAGILASGFINGVQSQNVLACMKHFACNNQEYARMVNDSILDERALFEIYLKPFEIAIELAKPKAIMCSYNKVNGTLASENPVLLKEILRDKFKFEGTVISDWGAVSSRVKALKAGLDLEMPGSLSYVDIMDALEKGEIDEEALNQRVESVLRLYQVRPDFKDKKNLSYHHIAKQAALESIVLLKNENQVLPLNSSEKIGIFGNPNMRIQGAGSSKVNPKQVDSFLDCLRKEEIHFEYFDTITDEVKQMDKVICFVGLSSVKEIEGKDRKDLKLDEEDIRLVWELTKLHSKVIIVLTTGSVVELPFIDSISGLVLTYLAGEASASALCDILYNKTNPSGHLAETWIKKLEDSPVYDFGKSVYQTFYRESIFVGYRYYDKVGIEPLFPFGYGLSYTQFKLSDIQIKKDTLSAKIKNIGLYKGKEVVQLYVRDLNEQLVRPVRELKAFQKIELAPNEEAEITFKIQDSFFEYYDVSEKKFKVSGGTYALELGTSSRDILLSKEYKVNEPMKVQSITRYHNLKSVKEITKKDFEELCGKSIAPLPKKYPFTLDSPMIDIRTKWIGKVFVYFGLKALKKRSQTKEEFDMNQYTFLTGPVRMIGMGVKKTNYQLEGIVDILNGKIIRGAIRFLKKDKRMKKLKIR